jgi:hypothetical protein
MDLSRLTAILKVFLPLWIGTAKDINKINLLTEIKVANGEIFLNDFGEN